MYKSNTPVVLFIFKRIDKSLKIIERIREVQPDTVFLISDAGRNEQEQQTVEKCRDCIENAIDWPCKIIKNYAKKNEGCFNRIGLGAIWVFTQVDRAIFLEDDNLPALSFFRYCDELLEKYADSKNVLWICGTNYLKKFKFKNNASYGFTQHMLPCGWASWSDKFTKNYDSDFSQMNSEETMERIKREYLSKRLYEYDFGRWNSEYQRKKNGTRYISWDYQMCFSIRASQCVGIVPKYNQIENIGVDMDSIHGGSSFLNIMTRRFCGVRKTELEFPLNHPNSIELNKKFEKMTEKIVTPPRRMVIIHKIKVKIRHMLKIPDGVSIYKAFKKK